MNINELHKKCEQEHKIILFKRANTKNRNNITTLSGYIDERD